MNRKKNHNRYNKIMGKLALGLALLHIAEIQVLHSW